MKAAVFLFFFFGMAVSFADPETVYYGPALSDLEMRVRTDKKSYYVCEPVTLIVSIANKTDKEIHLPFAKYDQWLNDYSLTLQSPVNTSKNITEEGDKWNPEERKARPAPSLRYKNLSYIWRGDKGCYIPPHGTYNFKIPLSRCFDLSFPSGEYIVTVGRHIGFSKTDGDNYFMSYKIESSTYFEMKQEHASSQKIAFENMSRMIGGQKTIGILCDEAEEILSDLERKEKSYAVYTPAYDRLMMILRTLDDVVNFDFSKINRSFIWEDGGLYPEETRKYLEHCRTHLKLWK